MPSPRPILRLILGECGPADMVMTRSADSVHFRLPNQRCGWRAYLLILSAASLGAIVLALLFGVPALALVMVAAYLAWRFTWNYELTLNEKRLSVDCLSSWTRRTKCVIALAHIGQFTVVRHVRTALLQAESGNDETEPILFDRSADTLERLARMLSEQHAALAGRKPPIRVAVESPLGAIRAERLRPPLNTRIAVNWHANGIMLDFPVPPLVDPEPASWHIRKAFFTFVLLTLIGLAGVGLILAASLGHGEQSVATVVSVFSLSLFCISLVALHAVAPREFLRSGRGHAACWLRRLIVTEDVLIRTMLNGGKQVWYRDEIEHIGVETERTLRGDRMLWLRLVTKQGEHENLLGAIEDRGVADYRPRAELEWVATMLQRTLAGPNLPVESCVAPKPRDWHADHIQDRGGYRRRD